MALPSASSARTLRPGLAMAAPVASGSPWPIAPPVRVSQVMRGVRPRWPAGSHTPLVLASSETIAPSGKQRPDHRRPPTSPVRSPSGSAGRAGLLGQGLGVRGDQAGQRAVSAPPMSSATLREQVHLAALGHQGGWALPG